MSRKKKGADAPSEPVQPEDSQVRPEPAAPDAVDAGTPTAEAGAPARANPYRAIFTCSAKGFELGEDRRFKQMVFRFKGNPGAQVTARLKEHGFVYRAAERSWTLPASAANRELAVNLAREFKGEDIAAGR